MEGRYRYRHYRPPKHRFRPDETPEHQVAYTIRTDILVPEGKGRTSYLPRCTCGWKDDSDRYVTMKVMYLRWDDHMLEVHRQGTLWPNY